MTVTPGDRIHIWSDDGKVWMRVIGRAASLTILAATETDHKEFTMGCNLEIKVTEVSETFGE